MGLEQLIEGADFFKGLSGESRRALVSISAPRKLKKKEILFVEGDGGHALFLLESGAVQLHKTTAGGREVVIRVVRPGDMFAEVILFEEESYPVTAVALKDSVVYQLPKARIHSLLSGEKFRSDFIRNLLAKHRYLTSRLVDLTLHDVEDRFFRFLKSQFGAQEEILPSMSKKDVAAAIGATPETLSRLLLRLRKEKKISWEGKRIRLKPDFWRMYRSG